MSSSSRAWYISRELKDSGIDTIVVTRKAASDRITDENIVAIKPILSQGFTGNLLFLLQVYAAVLRILFNFRIYRVIARGYSLAPLMFLLKFWRKRIIYDFHGYAYKEQIVERRLVRAKVTQPFDWLALNLADFILVIREELCQDLPFNFRKKALLLPNGVDLEVFSAEGNKNILSLYGLPADKILIGFIGNWEAWIAFEDMLDSSNYFDSNVQLVVIGAGKGLERYKAAYPSIIFTGTVPHQDAVALLKKIDVCLCPYSTQRIAKNKSYRKVLEYLAAGKPIVASNADSREKFLVDGQNALLYNSGDPKDLAQKIVHLLENRTLYEKISKNNVILSQEYTWDKVIKQSGLITILRD